MTNEIERATSELCGTPLSLEQLSKMSGKRVTIVALENQFETIYQHGKTMPLETCGKTWHAYLCKTKKSCATKIKEKANKKSAEIVKCENCKHLRWSSGVFCSHPSGLRAAYPETYCSYGKRRESEASE